MNNFSIYPNYTKRICYILGIKQKQLAQLLDASNVTVNRWASNTIELPAYSKKTFDILEENYYLRKQLMKDKAAIYVLIELLKTRGFKNV